MSVSPFAEWRREGCDDACRPRQHDPDTHEAYGYRQAVQSPPPTTLEVGDLYIDFISFTVTVSGDVVMLSKNEWSVLAFLARNVGRWCSYTALIAAVWPGSDEGHYGKSARVTIHRLRDRLGSAQGMILTRMGFGYMLVSNESPPSESLAKPVSHRLIGRWARNYASCTWCHRTDSSHEARGLCRRCYQKQKNAGKFI